MAQDIRYLKDSHQDKGDDDAAVFGEGIPLPKLMTPEQEREGDGQQEDLSPDEVEVRVGLVGRGQVAREFRTRFRMPGTVRVDH